MRDLQRELRRELLAASKNGLTRYAISKTSGLDQSALSRFAHGTKALSLESAAKLAAALGLELRLMPAEQKTSKTSKTATKRGGG